MVEWSEIASLDLEEIFDQIALDSPQNALLVDSRINVQVLELGHFQEMGRVGRIENTRELVIDRTPYIVVYTVEAGHVVIRRILHGAQRWPSVI